MHLLPLKGNGKAQSISCWTQFTCEPHTLYNIPCKFPLALSTFVFVLLPDSLLPRACCPVTTLSQRDSPMLTRSGSGKLAHRVWAAVAAAALLDSLRESHQHSDVDSMCLFRKACKKQTLCFPAVVYCTMNSSLSLPWWDTGSNLSLLMLCTCTHDESQSLLMRSSSILGMA